MSLPGNEGRLKQTIRLERVLERARRPGWGSCRPS